MSSFRLPHINQSPTCFCFCCIAEFPTSAAELAAVFSMFDGNKTGFIQYKSFADTVMRPDKQVFHTIYM
jgi:hypothetical protein